MSFPVYTEEQAHALELKLRGELARKSFDLASYEDFHWCIFQHDLFPHERRNLRAYFEEWGKDQGAGARGVLNKAARGLFKSTDSGGFLLFAIGHYPHLSNLVVQARDDDAKKTGNLLADTIQSNAGWKACFPNIVPDPDRGWSENGYNVKDTSMKYEEWVQKVVSDHKRDPSFMAVSVTAGAIGMHPTGALLMDDIHDSKNTESLAEMAKVVKTVKADIIPTMTQAGHRPMFIVAYTPWKPNDTYAELEKSGIYRQLVTPAFVEVSDAEYIPGDPYYGEFEGMKVRLSCPAVYPVPVLEQQLKLLGIREFSRQLRITLDVGKGQALPFYTYTLIGNEYMLPFMGGADPTGVEPDKMDEGKKRSFFALAFVARLPQGGLLVYDGILRQCSHEQAMNEIEAAQSRFPGWQRTLIEAVGPGAGFWQLVQRNLGLRVIKSDLVSIDEKGRSIVKGKDDRILEMATWFEDGTVKIADRRSDFLDALRYLFDHFWELNKNTPHPAWDAGDATYHALKGFPDVLINRAIPEALPQPGQRPKVGLGSAWNSLGRT